MSDYVTKKSMSVEKAQEIHSSVLWESVCAEIDNIIESLIYKLKTVPKDDLEAVQMEIRTWERVKRLPQDVIDRES